MMMMMMRSGHIGSVNKMKFKRKIVYSGQLETGSDQICRFCNYSNW